MACNVRVEPDGDKSAGVFWKAFRRSPIVRGKISATYLRPVFLPIQATQQVLSHPVLILSLNFPEHLYVTTRLGASIISLPVAGFRPLRSDFTFTQNLPKPLIKTSSPDSRVFFMISSSVSIVSVAFFFVKPFCSATAWIISALVNVILLPLSWKVGRRDCRFSFLKFDTICQENNKVITHHCIRY